LQLFTCVALHQRYRDRTSDGVVTNGALFFIMSSQISKSTESAPLRGPIYFVRTVRCGYLSDWGRYPQTSDNANLAGSAARSSPGMDQ
jgi:hypothetical protein